MDRCTLSGLDLEDIQELAAHGIIKQAKNELHASEETVRQEQSEYAHVLGHAGVKLEELA